MAKAQPSSLTDGDQSSEVGYRIARPHLFPPLPDGSQSRRTAGYRVVIPPEAERQIKELKQQLKEEKAGRLKAQKAMVRMEKKMTRLKKKNAKLEKKIGNVEWESLKRVGRVVKSMRIVGDRREARG